MPYQAIQSHSLPVTDLPSQLARHIGRRLRVMRSRSSISQAALSKLSGITRSQISLIEAGQVVPTVTTIARISSALGAGLADLVCGATADNVYLHPGSTVGSSRQSLP